VAEHIHPDYSDIFVNNLTSASNLIIFGAATERQSGDLHVNCRRQSYWISQFEKRGYQCFDFFRPKYWRDVEVPANYAQNIFLFAKKGKFDDGTFDSKNFWDVEHPLMINEYVKRDYQI